MSKQGGCGGCLTNIFVGLLVIGVVGAVFNPSDDETDEVTRVEQSSIAPTFSKESVSLVESEETIEVILSVESESIQAPTAFVQPPQTQPVVRYSNCDEVRQAGAAPIYPGDPGWQEKFDRDNDGVGCEL